MFSHENLYHCCKELKAGGGTAPGIDGITWKDLSPSELSELVDRVSQCVRDGSYRPYPTRERAIPKPGKKEKRTIRIATLGDRLVGKVLQDELDAALDKVFLDGSFGFRRKRGTWRMLADLEATMVQEACWVLALDDIRKAFDNIRIHDALQSHRRLFELELDELIPVDERDRLLDLIERVLRVCCLSRNWKVLAFGLA